MRLRIFDTTFMLQRMHDAIWEQNVACGTSMSHDLDGLTERADIVTFVKARKLV